MFARTRFEKAKKKTQCTENFLWREACDREKERERKDKEPH